ncbi:MAG TPA: YgiQ family radical SAM protein, partial [Desulfosalsimonadaceae bacterium]|nr:YgiQ family radical SAM protein [Desulfosalsimonadaceae bacterium]
MFLPATQKEAAALGWEALDVILITGDAYIDAPHIGISVIGKTLVRAGFRVGIISQPDTGSGDDIARLGEPLLFWGVSAGCMDSMIANYTPTKKPRKQDDL